MTRSTYRYVSRSILVRSRDSFLGNASFHLRLGRQRRMSSLEPLDKMEMQTHQQEHHHLHMILGEERCDPQYTYENGPRRASNWPGLCTTGKMQLLKFPDNYWLTVGKKPSFLSEVHFRAPSENAVNGKRARMSIQLGKLCSAPRKGAGVQRMKVPLGKLSVQLHSYRATPLSNRRWRSLGMKRGERPLSESAGRNASES